MYTPASTSAPPASQVGVIGWASRIQATATVTSGIKSITQLVADAVQRCTTYTNSEKTAAVPASDT